MNKIFSKYLVSIYGIFIKRERTKCKIIIVKLFFSLFLKYTPKFLKRITEIYLTELYVKKRQIITIIITRCSILFIFV